MSLVDQAFECANRRCCKPLGVDHVTLVTTRHVRRFCSVECVVEGHNAHLDALAKEALQMKTAKPVKTKWPRPCDVCGEEIEHPHDAAKVVDPDGVELIMHTDCAQKRAESEPQ